MKPLQCFDVLIPCPEFESYLAILDAMELVKVYRRSGGTFYRVYPTTKNHLTPVNCLIHRNAPEQLLTDSAAAQRLQEVVG